MKERIKIIIIIGVILIAILGATIAIIKYQQEKNSYQYEIMGIKTDELDKIPNLNFSGISEISVITSVSSQKNKYAKSFEIIFEEDLPELYNAATESGVEISEYYKNNEEIIKQKLYNIGENNFIALIEKMKTMSSNFETDFDICTFSANEDKVTLDITCTYKNGESIVLNLDGVNYLTFLK